MEKIPEHYGDGQLEQTEMDFENPPEKTETQEQQVEKDECSYCEDHGPCDFCSRGREEKRIGWRRTREDRRGGEKPSS